jgi:hypothetical protein
MAYGNPVIKQQPTPVTPKKPKNRFPANRRVAPKVITTIPEVTNPRISVDKILKLVGKTVAPYVAAALSPTRAADATIDWGPELYNDFDTIATLNDMVIAPPAPYNIPTETFVQAFSNYERPTLPEIPWADYKTSTLPGYTKSPKKGTLIVTVPDYEIPEPIPMDADPAHDIWNVPEDVPFERLFPSPLDEPSPSLVPEIMPKVQSRVNETGVTLELSRKGQRDIRLKVRPTKQRASVKRKKDVKANRKWLKATHMLISVTFGTYTEILDLLEALAWNSYQMRNGKKIPAMPLEEGKLVNILIGVLDGKYDVDMEQLIIDYTYMQLQDYLIGKTSQAITSSVIDSGGWQSPIGPESFVNKKFDNEELDKLPVDKSFTDYYKQKGIDYVSKTL